MNDLKHGFHKRGDSARRSIKEASMLSIIVVLLHFLKGDWVSVVVIIVLVNKEAGFVCFTQLHPFSHHAFSRESKESQKFVTYVIIRNIPYFVQVLMRHGYRYRHKKQKPPRALATHGPRPPPRTSNLELASATRSIVFFFAACDETPSTRTLRL
jgi:hypothetical protein